MRTTLVILMFLLASSDVIAAKSEPCDDTFYGTVNYDDITDQRQRVVRQEKFKFRSWSSEEQFDDVLVKLGSEIRDGTGVQVRVVFSTPPDAGSKVKVEDVVRVANLSSWPADQKFYVLGNLNMKYLVRHEAPKANRFSITAEKEGRVLCSRVYPISRGD